MNEYEFEYEISQDGWYSTHRVWAANKFAAYEEFTKYLKECDIDPATVIVLNCYVSAVEGGEEDETNNL